MATAGKSPTILLIDDDADLRYSLKRILAVRQYEVLEASSGEEGVEIAEFQKPDLIFLDNRMGGISGIEALQHLRSASPKSLVVLMTAYGTTQTAIEAMKFGAFDYIIKPFDVKRVLGLAEKAMSARADLSEAGKSYVPLLNSEDYKEGIVGSSEAVQEVLKTIGQVAASDVTVMITGESGTGKELVARCLYQHSHRGQQPFVAVNCAAIPDNLIESELFGHEKGSFTGATTQRIGKFEICDKGTIFLDEIGDMSLQTQTKMLRALQEGEIQRVGGSETIKVNVRMIAATNKDLEKMVGERRFREDLYYRLNVVRIRLPALRERLSDVPQLVDFMLQRLRKEHKLKVKKISSEALTVLSKYIWPGNVRELENVIHRSAVMAQGETILVKDLPTEVTGSGLPANGSGPADALETTPESSPESPETPRQATTAEQAVPKPNPAAAPDPAPPATEPIPASAADLQLGVPREERAAAAAALMSLDEAFDLVYSRIRAENRRESVLITMEREIIKRALEETGGNQVRTSALLGITRGTLRKRLEQFSLKV